MESANLYHHNHHHHLLSSSSSSSSSSSPSLGVSALQDWKWSNNPSSAVVLDGYDEELKRYMTEILPNSIRSSSTTTTPLQEIQFGVHNNIINVHNHNVNSVLQFDDDEINKQDYNFLKLSDDFMMNSYYDVHHHHDKLSWFLGGNSFPIPKQINGESFDFAASSSADHSNSNLGYANKYQSFEERNSLTCFQVQQSSSHSASTSSNKTSKFRNVDQKVSAAASNHHQIVVPKRPRLSSSYSSPTLKVRKEKLGDRIAALHRMVSPFGKTDTASVLTEAIGYIQFLQDQIQTLTMSYSKSSRSKPRRNARVDSATKDDHHNQHQKLEDDQKTYQDLRSRGLCLVPLSFTSYICSYKANILTSN